MLSSIPRYGPMFIPLDTAVPIVPTSIESISYTFMVQAYVAPPESTLQSIDSLSMQLMQPDLTPVDFPSTALNIESISFQFMVRA